MARANSGAGAGWRRLTSNVERRIKESRRVLGLTEDDLASALSVGRDTIEAYEGATTRVPSEHPIKLAEVLGVSISYFFPAAPCPMP